MKSIIFPFTLFFCLPLFAEINQQALLQTQNLLRDSSKRDLHIKESSPQAQQAIQMLRSMGISKQQEDELLAIAADSFKSMLGSVDGDTSKLKDELAKGVIDPKSFLENMDSHSKRRIRDLSNTVEEMNQNERK